MKTNLCAALVILLVSAAAAGEERFTVAQLREDADFLAREIRANHPNLAHSVDTSAFDAALESLAMRLVKPMTRDEAWREFATLNPVLADGHLFVALPDWRGAAEAHRAEGGTFFPFEVVVREDGSLYVKALLDGAPTPRAGSRIRSIDGRNADDVGREVLARAHGDTPAFRAELASRRFWFYAWKLFGAPATYDIAFADGAEEAEQIPASRAQPVFLADEATFDRQFSLSLFPNNSALLTVSTFAWPDKEKFLAFTGGAFTRIRGAGTRRLVIDVRANGGGDDDFWIEGLMPYLATKPYRWASSYEKRVLEQYRDEGETPGTVVRGPIDRWIEPDGARALGFNGELIVLVGPSTYSSAILFANVIQDFGFGKLAGTGGASRADQSGGIQRSVLPNTGLVVYWPRFILARPSGARDPRYLEPDIVIETDPFAPGAAAEELLSL
jgi:Peptidase family S41